MSRLPNNKGFTIIEVLIVLAIAGLIMLIVFLAVPALQRNSRNTQRRSEIANLSAAITEFVTNHNKMPVASDVPELEESANISFFTTVSLGVNNNAVGTTEPDTYRAYIKIAAKCNAAGDNAGGSGPVARNAAVVYFVETTGDPQGICQQIQ